MEFRKIMEFIKAREGDFIETIEGLIFDVKGLVHPPNRVIAYLRYFEDPLGERLRNGKRYRKVYSLSERDNILKEKYPQYLYYDEIFGELLEGVYKNSIVKHYKPEEKNLTLLKKTNIDIIEKQALKIIQILHDYSKTPIEKLGISGSILINLHTIESDIDIIVYGRRNCINVYECLKDLVINGKNGFSKYNFIDFKKLYDFRSKDTWIPFEEFYKIEKRKISQGKFLGRDFFIRFILDWDEITEKYGDYKYINLGRIKIKAKIEDDDESIFTPCKYIISEAEIIEGEDKSLKPREIVSFRGRFCEQAKRGEWVIAEGKIEKVISRNGEEYCRLILGNKPSDYMIIKNN